MKRKFFSKKTGFIVVILIITAAITAAIGIGTYLAVKFSDDLLPDTELTTENEVDREGIESVESDETVVTKSGFPYNSQDGYIRNIVVTESGNIAVLEDGCLTLLNSRGNILFCAVHSFSSPMMKCAGNRILLYDKASGFYRLFDLKGEYLNGNLEDGHILTGDICKNGIFSLVSSSNGSASYLTVFSKDGKKREFKWKCSPEHIVCTALSPNGKTYAAAALSAENGSIVSKVYFFDSDDTQTPEPRVLESGAVIEIKFISSKLLSVVSEEGREIINKKGETQGYPSSAELDKIKKIKSDFSGNTAILTDDLKGMDSQSVIVLDKKNAEKYETVNVESGMDIAVSQGRVYVLSDGLVSFYSSKGTSLGDSLVNDRCKFICASGSNAYCASDTQLFKVTAE